MGLRYGQAMLPLEPLGPCPCGFMFVVSDGSAGGDISVDEDSLFLFSFDCLRSRAFFEELAAFPDGSRWVSSCIWPELVTTEVRCTLKGSMGGKKELNFRGGSGGGATCGSGGAIFCKSQIPSLFVRNLWPAITAAR